MHVHWGFSVKIIFLPRSLLFPLSLISLILMPDTDIIVLCFMLSSTIHLNRDGQSCAVEGRITHFKTEKEKQSLKSPAVVFVLE